MRDFMKVFYLVIVLMFGFPLYSWCQDAAETDGLAAALQATMTHHPALKGKNAEIESYTYAIDSAEAGRYPTFSAQVDTLDEDYKQATLRVQQPLWTFGKINTSIKQAKATYTAEKTGLLQIQRILIEDTAAAYARLEGLRQQYNVAGRNIVEHEELYNRIERRQLGELASQADTQLAYSRLIQARAQQDEIEGELQVALTDLYGLTQIPVNTEKSIDAGYVVIPADIKNLAIEVNADLQYKKDKMEVAQLDIHKERIASLPNIFARVDQELWDEPSNGDRTGVGIVLEGRVEGFGFVSLGRIKGATASLNAAREDVNVSKIDVQKRIDTLIINRNLQETLRGSKQESVVVVEKTMESFVRQYESGRKSWLDVLNTQRELTVLRLQLAQVENEWLIVSVRIAAFTGQLDQLAGVEKI